MWVSPGSAPLLSCGQGHGPGLRRFPWAEPPDSIQDTQPHEKFRQSLNRAAGLGPGNASVSGPLFSHLEVEVEEAAVTRVEGRRQLQTRTGWGTSRPREASARTWRPGHHFTHSPVTGGKYLPKCFRLLDSIRVCDTLHFIPGPPS